MRSVLEDVHDADGGVAALDACLDERELLGSGEVEPAEPLGLGRQTLPGVGRLSG